MKKSITLALGAVLLMGAPSLAFATSNPRSNFNTNNPTAPGQVQKKTMGETRANEVAPGQLRQNPPAGTTVTGPGASQFAPGQVRQNPPITSTTNPARR